MKPYRCCPWYLVIFIRETQLFWGINLTNHINLRRLFWWHLLYLWIYLIMIHAEVKKVELIWSRLWDNQMISIIQTANSSYWGLLKLQKTLRFPTAFCIENLLIERMAGNYLSNTFFSQIIHYEFSISSTRNEQMTSLANFFQAFDWALMTV